MFFFSSRCQPNSHPIVGRVQGASPDTRTTQWSLLKRILPDGIIKAPTLFFRRSGLYAPQVGLEPTTLRLTAECSAIELLRIIGADDLSSAPLESGDDLLSRAVASQVPSARRGLTSVFGMGTGGSLLPLSPEIVFNSLVCSGLRPENHTGKADLEFTRSRMFACGIPAYAPSPLLRFLSSFQIKPSTD